MDSTADTQAREDLLDRLLRGEAGPAEPTGPVDAGLDGTPLSLGQQRIWFLDSVDTTGSEYVVPTVLALRGSLDVAALRSALRGLLRRHESLAIRVAVEDGEAVQRVVPLDEFLLPVTDLRNVPAAERADRARQLAAALCAQPFDLTVGPAARADLVRLAEDEWWLVLRIHHIAFDGGSRGVLLRDLARLYSGDVVPDRTGPSYATFAAGQRRLVESGIFADRVADVRSAFSRIDSLRVPADRPRPPIRDSRGGLIVQPLSPSTMEELRLCARRRGTTPFAVCLAAYALLLSRYGDQARVAVATPSDNRPSWDLRDVVGFFVNTLPMAVDVAAAPDFATLVDQVAGTVVTAIAAPQIPFEHLVDVLAPDRDPSRTPLCQAMLVWEEHPAAARPQLAGLDVAEVEFDRGIAKFDLTLAVRPDAGSGGADAALQYATSLFDSETAQDILARFRRLLDRLLAAPTDPLTRFGLLDAGELDGRPQGPAVPISDLRIEDLVRQQAYRTPDAVAVADDESELTYAEFAGRAERLGVQLTDAGVRPGDVVGVRLERSVDLAVAVVAVLMAGGAYLPLDPALPPARVAMMCADTGARVVVDADGPSTVDGETLPIRFEDLAYVLFTSGSTGRPKGVAVGHRALVNRLTWMRHRLAIGPDDLVLHKTPIGFDVSVWELVLPLITGARMQIARPGGHLEPQYLRDVIQSRGVTVAHFVPSMLRAYLASVEGPAGLRHLVCSGEQLDDSLAASASRHFGARVHNFYGPTEAAIDVTAHEWSGPAGGAVPIGVPVANTRTYVVDTALRPVPDGVPGELLLGGVQLADGYLGRPGHTAEQFAPDPFGPAGGRLYRTGDLVRRRRDGELEFLRRLDRQAKVRGMRVEPGEVEAALGALASVSAAAAAVRPGAGGEPAMFAWAVPAAGTQPSSEELLDHLRQTLPPHLVPTAVAVVPRIPVTANGKADLAALATPSGRRAADRRTPSGKVERTLARIWADVLRVGEESIAATDDFFALGGTSVLAVLVAMRIRQELHRSLPVGMLMRHPTIAQLAAAAGDESALRRYGTLVPLRSAGRLRPMFFVHSHGGHVFVYQQVAHYLDHDRPVYALRARGLDDDLPPFDDLPRMAAHYVDLIRAVQPHGPYAIAGWCLGGAVAYEMARQLHGAGERVDVLGIISLSAVQEMPEWEANDDAAFLGFILAGFLPDADELPGLAGHRNVPIDLSRMHSMGLDAQVEYVMGLARQHNALRPDVDTPDEARRLFEVYRAHRTAILKYELSRHDGPVVLFKAERNHLPDAPAGDLGWGPLAGGGLTVHEIPGTHFQLLQEPSVRVLASVLERHLGRLSVTHTSA
jgi:amino acid adenylation domain-containing protein